MLYFTRGIESLLRHRQSLSPKKCCVLLFVSQMDQVTQSKCIPQQGAHLVGFLCALPRLLLSPQSRYIYCIIGTTF